MLSSSADTDTYAEDDDSTDSGAPPATTSIPRTESVMHLTPASSQHAIADDAFSAATETWLELLE